MRVSTCVLLGITSLIAGAAIGWALHDMDWELVTERPGQIVDPYFIPPPELPRPAGLRRRIIPRGMDIPLLRGDRVDTIVDTDQIPIDWLDMEIFGDPVVARMYRLEAPDMHKAIRNAILAMLPEREYRIVEQDLGEISR